MKKIYIKLNFITILCCLLLGCSKSDSNPTSRKNRSWQNDVQVYGSLQSMFHKGQTGTLATLENMLPNPDLYAVGALTDLSGEVTIIGGVAFLSYPDGAEKTRTDKKSRSNAGITLLVAAEVQSWQNFKTEHAIRFDELDEKIATLAAAAGIGPDTRFPFILEGVFYELNWHVIDGSRLKSGGNSKQDHFAASIQAQTDRAAATLVGFYSTSDSGIFTHKGSKTHIHCVLDEPLTAGHVDHVIIPAATIIKFPVRFMEEK